jgi:hypothetical protein
MESSKIVSLNPFVTAINQRYVTAKSYNQLWDDFYATIVALGFDATLSNSVASGDITAIGTLTAATIVGSSAGTLGHSAGVIVLAAPGTGYVYEFVGGLLAYTFATAAYTGGGNDLNVRIGTVAQTAAITTAQLLLSASSCVLQLNALATNVVPTSNTTLNLKATTAYTQPGTAAGTLKYWLTYRSRYVGF